MVWGEEEYKYDIDDFVQDRGISCALSKGICQFCAKPLLWYYDITLLHDDVIKWKHFPRYWPFVGGIHRSPVTSPHKGQWRGPLMFSLICAWINGWVNNLDAGDLGRHHAHYDVIVMLTWRAATLLYIFSSYWNTAVRIVTVALSHIYCIYILCYIYIYVYHIYAIYNLYDSFIDIHILHRKEPPHLILFETFITSLHEIISRLLERKTYSNTNHLSQTFSISTRGEGDYRLYLLSVETVWIQFA